MPIFGRQLKRPSYRTILTFPAFLLNQDEGSEPPAARCLRFPRDQLMGLGLNVGLVGLRCLY